MASSARRARTRRPRRRSTSHARRRVAAGRCAACARGRARPRRSAARAGPRASLPGSTSAAPRAVPDAAAVESASATSARIASRVEHARPRGRSAAAAPLSSPARPARAARAATTSARRSARSSQSMPWRVEVGDAARRSSRSPSRSSASISSGKRARPFARPCVSDAMQKPPLRPLAPKPTRLGLEQRRRRAPGRRALACSAAHSPVKPPPTMHRSASIVPRKGGCRHRARRGVEPERPRLGVGVGRALRRGRRRGRPGSHRDVYSAATRRTISRQSAPTSAGSSVYIDGLKQIDV